MIWKYLLPVFVLLFSQMEAQNFRGQIYMKENATELFLNRAYVTNLRTQTTTLSGANGEFSITAKEGDVIRFTTIITARKDIRITQEQIDRSNNFIELKPEYHQIPEVVLSFRPTGDIRRDVYALKGPDKIVKVAEIIGLPEPKGDGYSPSSPVASLKDGGLSLDVQIIYNAISGDAARYKRLKNYEIMAGEIAAIRNYFGTEYFQKMKIPANLIDDFLQFIYLSDNIKIYVDSKNIEGTKPYIEKYLPIYLQRVRNSKLFGTDKG